jgi:endonuclease/exonuclease/phosphatase family metal-dependent hydrolase
MIKRMLPIYMMCCRRYYRRVKRRCSSMVEHGFRKAGVEGSTPSIGCGFWEKIMHSKKKTKSTKTTILTALLVLLVLLYLFCRPGLADTEPNQIETAGLQLRVMSFNIRYGSANDGRNRWDNRRDMVFDIFRNHKPDVAGLQEALSFQIDEILEALPQFGMVGVGRDDGKKEGEYCPVLYNRERFYFDESGTFWLSDTPEVPGSITWGNACTRICTWARFVERKSGRAFYIYNVHLDHQSQPSRVKSVILLAERISQRKHKDPFIVTGDFNAGESNPAILYLKGEAALGYRKGGESKNPLPLVDTFRVLYPDANGVGTFNQFRGIRSGDKIDYIFTTPGVKVLDSAILHDNVEGRYPSDHFPVIAKLDLAFFDSEEMR